MLNKLKKWLFPAELGFKYDAIDSDGDGIVQENTKFERKVTNVKKTTKKAAVKKTVEKKSPAKKSPAKKSPAKKTAPKKTTKKK